MFQLKMSLTIFTYLLSSLLCFATTICQAQLHYFQQQPAAAAAIYRPQPLYQHFETAFAAASAPKLIATAPAHPSVIANSLREAELPSELLKSERFYKNPHIAAALAKESWFTDKEMPVIDREAEKIPREEIFKIFHNAGWIKK